MHHSISKSLIPGGIRLTNAAKFFLLMLHFSFKYKVSYLTTFVATSRLCLCIQFLIADFNAGFFRLHFNGGGWVPN